MFIALERLLNLEEGYRRVFSLQGRSLLLMVVEGRTLLLENRCLHQGAPLHNATLAAGVLRWVTLVDCLPMDAPPPRRLADTSCDAIAMAHTNSTDNSFMTVPSTDRLQSLPHTQHLMPTCNATTPAVRLW